MLSVCLFSTVSKASILGSAELFVKKGSDINLTCVTYEAPEPPSHFFWYHGGQVSRKFLKAALGCALLGYSGHLHIQSVHQYRRIQVHDARQSLHAAD